MFDQTFRAFPKIRQSNFSAACGKSYSRKVLVTKVEIIQNPQILLTSGYKIKKTKQKKFELLKKNKVLLTILGVALTID